MEPNVEFQVSMISEQLRFALWQLGCFRVVESDNQIQIYEPELCGVYYSAAEKLAVISVCVEELPVHCSIAFFNQRKVRAVLNHLVGQKTDVLQSGDKIYFRTPLTVRAEDYVSTPTMVPMGLSVAT